MNLLNIYRIGIRNTFNIASKFLLLFCIFFFIIVAIFAEYTSFKVSENEVQQEYIKINFSDLSENRILIKKQDKTAFTEDDYEKIEKKANIDYILKNDWFADNRLSLYEGQISDPPFGNDFLFYNYEVLIDGFAFNIEKFDGKLSVGRMPENENEVIIKISQSNQYIVDGLNQVLDTPLKISRGTLVNTTEYKESLRATIVGIQYIEEGEVTQIYAYSSFLDSLNAPINRAYSSLSYLFNGHYTTENFDVVPSENVEKGFAIVNDELKYQLTKGNIKNQPITIYADNIHYSDEIELKISNTYTEKNFTKITGYEKYNNIICINEEDYNELFKKPFYQSSVYVKNVDEIDDTILELENIGIQAKKVTDYRAVSNEIKKQTQAIKIAKLSVTVIFVLTLFFISYFIIKIILKSRNIYYTTLRMLGVKYKNLKKILYTELFVNSSIAYGVVLFLIHLIKIGVLHFDYIAKLIPYLTISEYILMYLIMILMTRLLTKRFAKKTFEDTLINSYGEEI